MNRSSQTINDDPVERGCPMMKQNATLWLLLALFLVACGGGQKKSDDGGAPGREDAPAAEGARDTATATAETGEKINAEQARWLCGEFGRLNQSRFQPRQLVEVYAWCFQFSAEPRAYRVAAR